MQKWNEKKRQEREEEGKQRLPREALDLFKLLNTWHSATLLSLRLYVPSATSRKQPDNFFQWEQICYSSCALATDSWGTSMISRLINVLRARRPWDQCAADCTTGSSYYCLYGGEKRPLGKPVFPVYWIYCSHPLVWMAEGWSDKPSARQ